MWTCFFSFVCLLLVCLILLLLLQVGVIVTQLLLLILYTNSAFLFVGTCFLGLFISSVYPCMLAFTEDLLDYKGISDHLRD